MKESKFDLNSKNLKFIEYQYGDSSVPPEFHRSYKIHISKDKLQMVVDSYGDILTDKTFPLAKQDFKEILTAVKKIDFERKFPSLSGCTGGVSKTIKVQTATETFQISVYYCGNLPVENLTAEIDNAASIIVSKVPKLQKLLKRN